MIFMIHVYTGKGKGKTTTALGLGLRAIGAGKKVLMIQFLKSSKKRISELVAIREHLPNFEVKSYGRPQFVTKKNLIEDDYVLAREGLFSFVASLKLKRYDMIILDEINMVLDFGLIKTQEFLKILKNVPKNLELILTGRNAPKEIIKTADLVTEMKEVKHYYKKGVRARKGVEY